MRLHLIGASSMASVMAAYAPAPALHVHSSAAEAEADLARLVSTQNDIAPGEEGDAFDWFRRWA